MSATEHQFRGVAFGGFNRQDVLNYVENTFAEHGRQICDLKKELKQAEEICAQQAAALAEAQIRENQCAEENSGLSATLADVQKKLAEQSDELEGAQNELAVLREKVRALEPGAEAYARIKDRAASMELEAHLRAQSILDEAGAHAKASRERVDEWLCTVQSGYDRLRTDVDATISHTSGELGRIQRSLGSVTADFTAHDDALSALIDCCQTETFKLREPIQAGGE